MKSVNQSIDDRTFRARMIELEHLYPVDDFGPLEEIDKRRKMPEIIEKLLLEFFKKLEDSINEM